jgi:predicted acetyltransferase
MLPKNRYQEDQILEIALIEVDESEKSVLRQLLELYSYDFSEFEDADVNDHGLYGYKYLDHYWTENTRYPFFIRVNGKLAGFVLISEHTYTVDQSEAKSVTEFFVMRKYRRKGIGKSVAFQVFEKFPGKWEVIQHGHNAPSKLFWEKTIGEYCGGNYRKAPVKTEDWEGQALLFDNSQRFLLEPKEPDPAG